MPAAPLFAPLPPAVTSPARPTQGAGAADVAGLFALLLTGAQPVEAPGPQGAGPSTPPAPALPAALADAPARAPVPPPAADLEPPLTAGSVAPVQPEAATRTPAPPQMPLPSQMLLPPQAG